MAPGVAASPAQVHVALLDAVQAPQKITLFGPCFVEGKYSRFLPAGKYEISAQRDRSVLLQSVSKISSAILLQDRSLRIHTANSKAVEVGFSSNSGNSSADKNSNAGRRSYKGMLIVSTKSSGDAVKSEFAPPVLKLINVVSKRDYLASVVASEMPLGAPLEALKAQAVLSNTQLARLGSRTIEDSTQVQSYLGALSSRPEAYIAVDRSLNQTLDFNERPIQAFFHSTCAGMTSKPVDIFGGNDILPYLTNVKCIDCSLSPFWKTTEVSIPKSIFETVFGGRLPEITSRDSAGRPTRVLYQFRGKPMVTNGYQFWLRLGQSFDWGRAPGTRFSLSEHDREVFIKSTGAGHGVGMCQYGAIGMARRGKTYAQILAFYFPGTALSAGTAPHRPAN